MTDRPNDETSQPSPEDAARILKDRIEYIREKNLMDLVEDQRRREKNSARDRLKIPRGGK